MAGVVTPSVRRKRLLSEIEEVRSQLQLLEVSESELRTSLSDARKQLSYYRNLVSSMKKAVSPTKLKKLIRFL